MQVSSIGGARNRRVKSAQESPLSLYDTPPTEEISLDEFEEFAYDRLRVLKAIEMHQARGIKGEALRQKMPLSIKCAQCCGFEGHLSIGSIDWFINPFMYWL